MLHYDFMRIALVVAILIGIALPLIGSGVVYKRLSSSGDALAHSSLAGVAIGLVAGFNPLVASIIACVISTLIIELLRKKFSKFAEIGVVVVLSIGVGIAGILSTYASSGNFESYLFGSILLISNLELTLVIIITVIVIIFSLLFYSPFLSILYSEEEAKAKGIKVGLFNFIHSLLLSLVVAIGAKVVGSLVVSSMLVLPIATSMQFQKGYKFTLFLGVGLGVISMVSGLIISYYADLRPGASIVLFAVAILLAVFIYKGIALYIKKRKRNT